VPPKPKKIPMRMCVACREMKPKRDLLRVVVPAASESNEALYDPRGKLSGRGAYICRSEACLKKAVKTRALERTLECVLPEDTLLALEKEASGNAAE